MAEDKRGLALAGLKICDPHATVVPVKAPQYGVSSDRKSRHASEVGDAAALSGSRWNRATCRGVVRASVHYYNSEDEIGRLCTALEKV